MQEGAAFALGVSEYQTGVIAAEMTVDAIKKGGNLAQALASLPVRTVKPYRLFLNPKAAAAQGVNLQQLKAANRNPLLVFNQ